MYQFDRDIMSLRTPAGGQDCNHMRKAVISYSSIIVFVSCYRYKVLRNLLRIRSVTGVCYAGNKVNRIYIPPPKSFLTRSGIKGGGKITVIILGFRQTARTAVEFAVNILESVLPSDVKVTVKASWTRISSAGVLANSSITGFATGWGIDALEPIAYYPVTVAEKISGKSLNEDHEADVELVLNSSAKWYLGTDGIHLYTASMTLLQWCCMN